jgi:hypothetical protein|uniref:Uncharacterized protein n=1 Tax=Zea mays TaxID=4577 RepID=C0P5M1_MAIZE|nr:unknown [Zea mays]
MLMSHSYTQVTLITWFLGNKLMATKVPDLSHTHDPCMSIPRSHASPSKIRDVDYIPCFFSLSPIHTHIYLVNQPCVHVRGASSMLHSLQDKLQFLLSMVELEQFSADPAMLLQAQIWVCVLCVAPGSQEHDSPYGVLGGRAAAVGATARFTGRRCGGGGAVGAPEFLTEGLLDLVSPGALPGRQLRGFHGRQKKILSYSTETVVV